MPHTGAIQGSRVKILIYLLIAVYVGPMLGIILTSAFWGRIGDRYGHKLMMIRALAGLSLTQLGFTPTTLTQRSEGWRTH